MEGDVCGETVFGDSGKEDWDDDDEEGEDNEGKEDDDDEQDEECECVWVSWVKISEEGEGVVALFGVYGVKVRGGGVVPT